MRTNFTKRETAELEQCKKSLIISWKAGKGGKPPRINDFFFNWCQRTNQPYIQITLKRINADIFMDLPNASGLLDKEGAEQFHSLCSDFGFPPQKNSPENPYAEGVPIEVAAEFASGLVHIGRAYCVRHKSLAFAN